MSTLRELSRELLDVRDLALDPDVPSQAIADTLDGMEGYSTTRQSALCM